MMRGKPLRRVFAGLFGLLFAVSGLTRELVGTCPQHAGGHDNGGVSSGVLLATVSAPAAAETHGGHHTGHDPAPHTSALGSDPAGTLALAPGPGDTEPGAHCDCIGDCCGCATVRVESEPAVAVAPDAPIAAPRVAYTAAERPAARVDMALPFATAPPVTHAT